MKDTTIKQKIEKENNTAEGKSTHNFHWSKVKVNGGTLPRRDYFDFLRTDQSGNYDFLPIGCLFLDPKGFIINANQAAAGLLGLEKNNLLNADFINFVCMEDQPTFQQEKNCLSDHLFRSFDVRLKKGQDLFWARITISLNDGCGFSSGLRLAFCDVHELRELEQENKELKQQLQQSRKMEAIGELSSGIAHDFNNILHPIIGSLELMIQDAVHDRNLQKALYNILAGANRASSLVKQILSFGHQKDIEVCPVRIQDIIREVVKLSRSTLPPTIRIIQTIDNDCRPVMADPTHIYQIAMNLITNACHAMGNDGGILDIVIKSVEITQEALEKPVLKPGSYVCLSISDTGKGIDASIAEKIFKPYFTTKEKGSGTGLGLTVISGIIKSYGGEICFLSKPAKGSRFEVYLPQEPLSREHGLRSLDLPNQVDQRMLSGCESILFVDDDPFIVNIQKNSLERNGYQVAAFINSQDALNEFWVRSEWYDLVICDMKMPDMDGVTLANKIKQIRHDIPVVICTGFSESVNEDNYREMGLDGYLMKPVETGETLKLIRHLLDNP